MSERTPRIPCLDGLRAFSIGLVILSHILWLPQFSQWSELRSWIAPYGVFGVRIFFVISGFLITRLLLEELRGGSINLPQFYFRRTMRLFPPFCFYLAAVVMLDTVGLAHITGRDLLHCLTYTVNYHPARTWDIGHVWSLSVEEQFYLLWPLALLLVGKRWGFMLAACLLLICPLIRITYLVLAPDLIRYEVGYRFETVADAIAVGCLFAAAHDWLNRQRLYSLLTRSPLLIILLLPLIMWSLALNPRLRPSLLVGITFQNIAIVGCIAWCLANPTGRVGLLLNAKPVAFIGLISYSLYLWQQLFLNKDSSAFFCQFPANVLFTFCAAVVSYFLVERQSFRLRRWLQPRIFRERANSHCSADLPPFPTIAR